MIFACIENEVAQQELQRAIKSAEKPQIYRRLLTIRLSAEGKTVNELANLFQLQPLTIRRYIHAYNENGLSGLIPAKKPGRTPLLCWNKEQWLNLLHQPPASFSLLYSSYQNWTLEQLAEYFKVYHGLSVTPQAIWYALRRHKINMGRSQLKVTSPDPEYTVKRQRVEKLKKKAETGQLTSDDVTIALPGIPSLAFKKKAVLVYFDETEIHWCPDIGKNYQPEGEQNRISSPGKDSICYIIGGIVYPTAEGLYEIFHRKRTMEVESYLL